MHRIVGQGYGEVAQCRSQDVACMQGLCCANPYKVGVQARLAASPLAPPLHAPRLPPPACPSPLRSLLQAPPPPRLPRPRPRACGTGGDNGSLWWWDWRSGHSFQQDDVQVGSHVRVRVEWGGGRQAGPFPATSW